MTTDPGGIVPAGVVPTHPTSTPPKDACVEGGEHVLSDDTSHGPGPTRVICACGLVTVDVDAAGNIARVRPS